MNRENYKIITATVKVECKCVEILRIRKMIVIRFLGLKTLVRIKIKFGCRIQFRKFVRKIRSERKLINTEVTVIKIKTNTCKLCEDVIINSWIRIK